MSKLPATIVVGALAWIAGGPAAAQEKPKDPQERIICRNEPVTGSRVERKRICATQRVWDQMREEHLQSNAHRKVDAERSRPFRF